ncbi:hypothetical protein K070079E91_01920 [Eisenbergiella porci]
MGTRGLQGARSRIAAIKPIEDEAPSIGCQLSHLTTYSFQASLFYQKCGYSICGMVDGFPDNIQLYVLKKQI